MKRQNNSSSYLNSSLSINLSLDLGDNPRKNKKLKIKLTKSQEERAFKEHLEYLKKWKKNPNKNPWNNKKIEISILENSEYVVLYKFYLNLLWENLLLTIKDTNNLTIKILRNLIQKYLPDAHVFKIKNNNFMTDYKTKYRNIDSRLFNMNALSMILNKDFSTNMDYDNDDEINNYIFYYDYLYVKYLFIDNIDLLKRIQVLCNYIDIYYDLNLVIENKCFEIVEENNLDKNITVIKVLKRLLNDKDCNIIIELYTSQYLLDLLLFVKEAYVLNKTLYNPSFSNCFYWNNKFGNYKSYRKIDNDKILEFDITKHKISLLMIKFKIILIIICYTFAYNDTKYQSFCELVSHTFDYTSTYVDIMSNEKTFSEAQIRDYLTIIYILDSILSHSQGNINNYWNFFINGIFDIGKILFQTKLNIDLRYDKIIEDLDPKIKESPILPIKQNLINNPKLLLYNNKKINNPNTPIDNEMEKLLDKYNNDLDEYNIKLKKYLDDVKKYKKKTPEFKITYKSNPLNELKILYTPIKSKKAKSLQNKSKNSFFSIIKNKEHKEHKDKVNYKPKFKTFNNATPKTSILEFKKIYPKIYNKKYNWDMYWYWYLGAEKGTQILDDLFIEEENKIKSLDKKKYIENYKKYSIKNKNILKKCNNEVDPFTRENLNNLSFKTINYLSQIKSYNIINCYDTVNLYNTILSNLVNRKETHNIAIGGVPFTRQQYEEVFEKIKYFNKDNKNLLTYNEIIEGNNYNHNRFSENKTVDKLLYKHFFEIKYIKSGLPPSLDTKRHFEEIEQHNIYENIINSDNIESNNTVDNFIVAYIYIYLKIGECLIPFDMHNYIDPYIGDFSSPFINDNRQMEFDYLSELIDDDSASGLIGYLPYKHNNVSFSNSVERIIKKLNELIQNGKLFNNKETYPYYLNDNRITDDIKLFKFPTINWIRGNYTYNEEEDTYDPEDGIYISNDTDINNRLKIFLDELNRLDF